MNDGRKDGAQIGSILKNKNGEDLEKSLGEVGSELGVADLHFWILGELFIDLLVRIHWREAEDMKNEIDWFEWSREKVWEEIGASLDVLGAEFIAIKPLFPSQ